MGLNECVEKHTYRQYLAWMEYLRQQWNEKTPIIYYLAQIAQEVRQTRFKKTVIFLKDLFIPFVFNKVVVEETVESKTAKSKSHWFGLTGFKKDKK